MFIERAQVFSKEYLLPSTQQTAKKIRVTSALPCSDPHFTSQLI